jgi:mannose-6-phosphate isomerase
MLYPLTFEPIFKERVWGGRRIEELYGKKLPPGLRIGESWEITDRPEGVSCIANGPLAGRDLRWLMENHRRELLGDAKAPDGRFPLLVKILDAQDKLSLQVHPPAALANELKGEPKTEMWFIADAAPGADLFVGLKRGVTRGQFEEKLRAGTVAECFHRLEVRRGDVMFLPSGRVHAIGAGNVIFEIQQNSDTTYRVFDWGRVGLDGKPREMHLEQAMRSIDFNDFEPPLQPNPFCDERTAQHPLVEHELFHVTAVQLVANETMTLPGGMMHILGVADGGVTLSADGYVLPLKPGAFCLLPACLNVTTLSVPTSARFLIAQAGGLGSRHGFPPCA